MSLMRVLWKARGRKRGRRGQKGSRKKGKGRKMDELGLSDALAEKIELEMFGGGESTREIFLQSVKSARSCRRVSK